MNTIHIVHHNLTSSTLILILIGKDGDDGGTIGVDAKNDGGDEEAGGAEGEDSSEDECFGGGVVFGDFAWG